MDLYRIYFVGTARSRPGKASEASKWWREEGEPFYASLPGVKSLQTYAAQFGLGGAYNLEFWYEIDDYAVMDAWDKVMSEDPGKYGPKFAKFAELFEGGPSRIMGDWPESRLVD